ncbi:lysine--tRNA ligase [Calidifontibacter sp. DB0510]|uniref:Lysine--tRNA ligase n=1 Tax=Metallococcus carri TaxID=1656884 RepID=A0A967EGS4_9MICO|nr:lysine--tRNA ligase [Metallococcus carri]NHN55458.1 lysine--tRNA ligase [Metallococcus carri]NOP38358.1 lysine--tRNA ligase [Calidifontibacter sp. DB2511S]
MTEQQLDDWVSRLADEVIADAKSRGIKVVCASGISPSGPIHLGNLREVMTPHLVADEVRRRGIDCEHIISWDDYDRFRKVPRGIEGVDDSWAEHIGKPLTAVPPPRGSDASSWAEHFRRQLEGALADLGIRYRGISQTQQYTSGAYADQVIFAMSQRSEIDKVLDQYRTLQRADAPKPQQKLDADQEAAAAEAAEGSGAATEDDGATTSGYFPYKPFCTVCNTDFTTVTAYNDATAELTYTCRCGHTETVDLHTFHHGKLVWKVDWPMRWAYEKVVFEPSGVDHQSPGSSYVVGKQLAPIFGWERPIGPMYAFVGIKGMAKMSSSKGGVPIPAEALQIMEPPLLRWLYARRRPNQAFDVAFDAEIQRMYDEWDALARKVSQGAGQAGDVAAWTRAISTADGELPQTAYPVAYRTLASIVDITTGDEDQTLRIVRQLDPADPAPGLDALRPRLDCVEHWVATRMAPEDRTVVRTAPDEQALAGADREALRILLDGNGKDLSRIEDDWSLDGLTHQVYGVPKVQRGLAADQIVKGDKELSAAQRAFFKQLYQLLIGKDTGPRLPTLLLAIGPERVRTLLGG